LSEILVNLGQMKVQMEALFDRMEMLVEIIGEVVDVEEEKEGRKVQTKGRVRVAESYAFVRN
jgi:hypothetical protein